MYFSLICFFFVSSTEFSFYNNLENSDPIHTAILYGDVNLGYYYVNVYIGTPPKKQTLIVSTNSYITSFPCDDCGENCGKHFDS